MDIIRSTTFIRPSIDVIWFWNTLDDYHWEYIYEGYIITHKVVYLGNYISSDNLHLTTVLGFTTHADEEEWLADPYIKTKIAERIIYNENYSITEIINK